MKKKRGHITIRCISPCISKNFEVIVFNEDNLSLFQDKTDQDGTASFDVCLPGEYQVCVRAQSFLSPQAATRWLFLCPNRTYTVYFLFNSFCMKPVFTTATFYLTDRNYGGLPIQKGDIQLCRVLM